jgi:hypothetical protein
MSNVALQKTMSPVAQTLTEKCLTPLWWLAIGYAFGFFHGNGRRKRKAAQA